MSDTTNTAGAADTGSAGATGAGELPPASTLLTDGAPGAQAGADDAAGKPAEGADGKGTEADGKPAGGDNAAQGAPESYADFTLPEGATLAPEVIEETKGLAKELNLSQEQAQRVADLLAKSSTAVDAAAGARQAEMVSTVVNGWIDEVRTDKDIGGEKLAENLAVAREAMDATTTPQLRELLKRSGLGNNVHVIKHFLQIAPAFRSAQHVPAGQQPTGKGKTPAEVLYDATPST